MKLLKIFLPLCVAVTPVLTGAEDPPDSHVKVMKESGELMGKLRKNVDVEASAKRMAVLYHDIGAFWTKRSEVGAKTSKEGMEASTAIARAAAANDAAGIGAGMKGLGASCKGCHDAHREKISDNVYKIK